MGVYNDTFDDIVLIANYPSTNFSVSKFVLFMGNLIYYDRIKIT